jgi:LysM repeat protein
MKDYKIVIDPGHGGSDPGASGNGIVEKNLTLDISKYMYDRFRELGIPVSITRLDDSTLSPSDRVNKILGFYGSDPSVIVISNHINAGGGDGAEVIYALRNSSRFADLIGNELKKEGQNFRKSYQRRLPSNSSKDYYFIHRNTGNTEPVIVEYGFLDSSKDDVNQLKNNYRNLSEAVVRAVLEYIGYEYQPSSSDLYIVKKGDSLWSIAKKYGLSVDDLKKFNNLNNNMLSIGQTLKISGEPNTNNDIYIVKKGDSLYSIASRYGISVSDLKSYNNLTGNDLSIGQELFIPTGQDALDLIGTDYDTYVVKPGDSLFSIANIYNTSVSNIRDINNLSSDVLIIGQQLLVPRNEEVIDTSITNFINYRVVSGDTLYSIASRNGISVDELKRINNLTSNNLSVNQVLKIPVMETTIYTVKKGDTLYNIAREYNTTVDEIMKKNGMTNNLLSIGQQIIL